MNAQRSSWAVGWTAFAGAMMVLVGALHIFQGIAAISSDTFWGQLDKLFTVSLTQWGWIHVIGGTIVLLAGVGVYVGNVLARTVGVLLAVISAAINFAWLPAYPVWSIILLVADFSIIWALTVHGRDITEPA